MNRKIIYFIILLLFGFQTLQAQTVQIHDVTVAPGEILVQVDMLDFTGDDGDVAAITLNIDFDSDLMSFVGIENTQLAGTWVENSSTNPDVAQIAFNAAPGVGYDINGKLLDLKFEYYGGFSGTLEFLTSSEIANTSLVPISATWVDGSVTQSTAIGTVSMDDLTELIGSTIDMPVNILGDAATGYESVDAITLKIEFDQSQLAYAGIVEDAITGVVASANAGVLTINWNGAAMDFTTLTHLLDVQFVYYGGAANVDFIPGCEIASATVPLATDYVNGTVAATPQSSTLTIESVGGTPGSPVSVPVNVDDIPQTIGSISLNISFDNTRLTYTGYTANQLSGWVVSNLSGGLLNFEWNGTGTVLTDGALITLNFNYAASGGVADIMFDPGCEIKTSNLVNVPVTYIDGLVGGFDVTGNVSYYSSNLVIPGTTVYLKQQSDDAVVASTAADGAGDFEFTGVVPGDYYLDATTTADAQYSYDQTDAFIIVGLGGTFTGIVFTAGDVNEDLVCDMTDAFIVYGSWLAGNVKVASWTAPDWVWENPTFSVVNADINQDFNGLCSGDVNADYVPIP